MAETKTKPTAVNPHHHIAALDSARRRADAEALVTMMSEISGEPPVMWGPTIIGFGRMRYQYETGHGGEMARQSFAPRAANTVLYVPGAFEGREELIARLGKIKRGAACIYVNRLEDLDRAALREFLERGYAATLEESPPG